MTFTKGVTWGEIWKAVIDISAVLMCMVSLIGLLEIFFLQKKRFSGLVSFAAGDALCYLAYAICKP